MMDKRIARYVAAISFVVLIFIGTQRADALIAYTTYYIIGVTCNADSHTINIFGHFTGGTGSGAAAYVYVNGTAINSNLPYISGYPNFPVTDSSIVVGAQILVSNPSTSTSASTTCKSSVLCPFTDGRLNCEADQTVAVYCDSAGGVLVYVVDHGIGYYDFHLTKAQVTPSLPSSSNTLLISKLGAFLYRLSDGSLQINRVKPDGKYYVFHWPRCG